jgi:hypothetical protein
MSNNTGYQYPSYRPNDIPVATDRIRAGRTHPIFLSPMLHPLLKLYAKEHNTTMSSVINEILAAFLAMEEQKKIRK